MSNFARLIVAATATVLAAAGVASDGLAGTPPVTVAYTDGQSIVDFSALGGAIDPATVGRVTLTICTGSTLETTRCWNGSTWVLTPRVLPPALPPPPPILATTLTPPTWAPAFTRPTIPNDLIGAKVRINAVAYPARRAGLPPSQVAPSAIGQALVVVTIAAH